MDPPGQHRNLHLRGKYTLFRYRKGQPFDRYCWNLRHLAGKNPENPGTAIKTGRDYFVSFAMI
jgi:hypothetical protein